MTAPQRRIPHQHTALHRGTVSTWVICCVRQRLSIGVWPVRQIPCGVTFLMRRNNAAARHACREQMLPTTKPGDTIVTASRIVCNKTATAVIDSITRRQPAHYGGHNLLRPLPHRATKGRRDFGQSAPRLCKSETCQRAVLKVRLQLTLCKDFVQFICTSAAFLRRCCYSSPSPAFGRRWAFTHRSWIA